MWLSELIGETETGADTRITGFAIDSRKVAPGTVFGAFRGLQANGEDYIPNAIAAGAVAIFARPEAMVEGAVHVADAEPRRAFARAAAKFFAPFPEAVVAVTGTNGKTSTVELTRQLWRMDGHHAASIGTLGVTTADDSVSTGLTTPDIVTFLSNVAGLKREGVTHVAFEASSHGLAQFRTDGKPEALERVIRLLDRVVAAAQAADRGGSIIEARLVRALAHQARGDSGAALEDLGHALVEGVPAGYVRLFLDEGPPLEELLRTAAARSDLPGAEPAADLLRAADTGPSEPAEHSQTAQPRTTDGTVGGEGISDRELEVLRLLATELTGPEIAQHLYVSLNTLRSHTKHIFTKLDVNTRRAAVRRATDLGLL